MAEYIEHSRNEGSIGSILQRLSALEKDVADLEETGSKLFTDMYYGNGKPGITTRMAMSEDAIEKIGSNLSKLVWLGLATFFTVIGFVIEQLLTRGPHS